ncbi:MAG: MFS transporter [Halobacteriaceae archaeon]
MRRPTLESIRNFDRPVYIVSIGQLTNIFGRGLVYPFATIHFHLFLGIPLAIVGLGFLLKNIASALATAIGGFLADRYGRRPVMIGSMGGNAITLTAYAFVPVLAIAVGGITLGSAFVLVSIASGLTSGLYTPAAQAYIADVTDDRHRDQAFSLLKVANNVGFGTGFVVGGILYSLANVSIFIADGITSAIVAGLFIVGVPRTKQPTRAAHLKDAVTDWQQAMTKPPVIFLAVLNIGFAIMYAQMQTTIPIVAKSQLGLESSELGTLFVLNPLTLVLFQIPLVEAITHWRRTRGLVLSTVFWAISMLAVWIIFPLNLPIVIGIVLIGSHIVLRTVGEVLHSPLITSLMSDIGTTAERGSQLSLLNIAKRLGFGLGSFIGGLFFDYGLAGILWPILALTCAGIGLGLLVFEQQLSLKSTPSISEGD